MNVAVAGATGAVGVEMLETLEKRNFPVASIKLLASARSAGKKVKFRGGEITIEEMKPESFKGMDIALFSAGSDVSKLYRQACVDAGCVMIDNSSAFRMDDDVPLVIPEINPEDAFKHHGVIANPNCTTAIMAVAVYPLHKAKGLKRLIASTYQAASGGGAPAMQELLDQTREVLNGAERVEPKVMAQQIAFNLFPHIDSFQPNGYTKEELKMVNETRKIMHIPNLMLTCTSVRVPIMRAHSESLNLEFEQEITPEEAREILVAHVLGLLKKREHPKQHHRSRHAQVGDHKRRDRAAEHHKFGHGGHKPPHTVGAEHRGVSLDCRFHKSVCIFLCFV